MKTWADDVPLLQEVAPVPRGVEGVHADDDNADQFFLASDCESRRFVSGWPPARSVGYSSFGKFSHLAPSADPSLHCVDVPAIEEGREACEVDGGTLDATFQVPQLHPIDGPWPLCDLAAAPKPHPAASGPASEILNGIFSINLLPTQSSTAGTSSAFLPPGAAPSCRSDVRSAGPSSRSPVWIAGRAHRSSWRATFESQSRYCGADEEAPLRESRRQLQPSPSRGRDPQASALGRVPRGRASADGRPTASHGPYQRAIEAWAEALKRERSAGSGLAVLLRLVVVTRLRRRLRMWCRRQAFRAARGRGRNPVTESRRHAGGTALGLLQADDAAARAKKRGTATRPNSRAREPLMAAVRVSRQCCSSSTSSSARSLSPRQIEPAPCRYERFVSCDTEEEENSSDDLDAVHSGLERIDVDLPSLNDCTFTVEVARKAGVDEAVPTGEFQSAGASLSPGSPSFLFCESIANETGFRDEYAYCALAGALEPSEGGDDELAHAVSASESQWNATEWERGLEDPALAVPRGFGYSEDGAERPALLPPVGVCDRLASSFEKQKLFRSASRGISATVFELEGTVDTPAPPSPIATTEIQDKAFQDPTRSFRVSSPIVVRPWDGARHRTRSLRAPCRSSRSKNKRRASEPPRSEGAKVYRPIARASGRLEGLQRRSERARRRMPQVRVKTQLEKEGARTALTQTDAQVMRDTMAAIVLQPPCSAIAKALKHTL
eukprot:GHVT01020970.1.p1 GENE.GHVT01020970.1~~GHVT01020970.1.p1  ORF type:complete len:814 (-),score=149.83 GHVT01020970.1:425-2596(-)